MLWIKTDNPRVWQATNGQYHAMAEEVNGWGEGGFTGRVYARPAQMSFLESQPVRVGPPSWGGDPEAAFRRVIRGFDPEAILPGREEVSP